MRCLLPVSLLALLLATPVFAADGPRWCSGVVGVVSTPEAEEARKPSKTAAPAEAPASETRPLKRIGVRWDVELRGALATGTLIETYTNTSAASISARYRMLPAPGFRVVESKPMLEGSELDLETEAPEAETPTRGRRTLKPPPGLEQSQDFEVPSGAQLEVRVTVQSQLRFDSGWYQLTLPLVTSDCRRQLPQESDPAAESLVPLQVSVQIHHEETTAEIDVLSHAVNEWGERFGTVVELSEPALAESEPFSLRYRLQSESEEEPSLSGWVSEQTESGTRDLLVVLTPPHRASVGTAGNTDVVFVLDTSGSMKGAKLASARAGLQSTLDRLDREDSFSLIRFSDSSSRFDSGLSAASSSERGAAKDWLAGLQAEGGTKLNEALEGAMKVAKDGSNHPIVVVLTDGAIHDAEAVEKVLDVHGGSVRVLFLGIGAEPQAAVLQRLAGLARGDAAFAREAGEVEAVLGRLFGSFSSPLAWDLRLEAAGAEIVSISPARIPDLYEGRPVTLFVRVRGPLPDELLLQGASVAGEQGFRRSLLVADVPEAPGLRGPAAVEGKKRRR